VNRDEYAGMSACEMAAHVRSGELSPIDLIRASLEAIDVTDRALNAYSEVFEQNAMRHASMLEEEARRKEFRGPLHGVPFAVKDLFNVKGTLTRRGSRLYADTVSSETAPSVERMFAAGAIMVGKNTTPELGWKASSNSPLYGVTRNPWDTSRTTGGSSSGSAAAVAAGTVPISLGSDGGGSMRIPASFCGIFSLKATLGRIPTYPLSPTEHLSHAGPMTNSVPDYALALDAMAGPDNRDPNSIQRDTASYLAELDGPGRRLRVAFAPTLFGKPVAAEVERVVASAVDQLRGHPALDVCNVAPGWADPVETFELLWTSRGSLYLHLDEDSKTCLDPGLSRMIGLSTDLRVADQLRALQQRAAFCRLVADSFDDFDILITPMVPIEPFRAEADGPDAMDLSPNVPWARWTPFSYPFNLTGQPAASIPCGWSESGLPVGMQVIGRRFDDLTVLRFCRTWERLFDWRVRRPSTHAAA
jgi:aspartyl-tRNA(Asn)/glutamyl-tRNA(Gln) amidotransferase subunit A